MSEDEKNQIVASSVKNESFFTIFKGLISSLFGLAILLLGLFLGSNAIYKITVWAYASTTEKLGSFLGAVVGVFGFMFLGLPAGLLIFVGFAKAALESDDEIDKAEK
jgi:hypothetical protein